MEILIVDDDYQILQALKRKLEDEGHEVETFLSASDALETLMRDSEADLIITDYSMLGGMNGCELASAIRKCGYKMPIFLLTASKVNEVMAKTAGITQVFSKFKFGDLLKAIERLDEQKGN